MLEKLADPAHADSVNPNSYKFRLTAKMETGDDRYAWVNTAMWVGSGCRRGAEGLSITPISLILTNSAQSSTMRIASPSRLTLFSLPPKEAEGQAVRPSQVVNGA